MAKVARQIRVASNPRRPQTKKRGTRNTMTAAKKKAFVARMAKARKASSRNPSPRKNTTHRKSNPAMKANGKRNPKRNPKSNPTRSNKRKRNPEFLSSLLGDPKTLMIQAVVGLAAAVATRQIPQMAMGAKNVGWKGYLANAGTGLASTWLAGEFISRPAAQAALIGSTVIILDRVLTEKVSPIGQYLQLTGVGDATAATSLGSIADGYYIHPTIIDNTGRPIIPHEITDAALAAALQKYPQLGQQPARLGAAGGPAPHGAPGRSPSASAVKSRFGSRFH